MPLPAEAQFSPQLGTHHPKGAVQTCLDQTGRMGLLCISYNILLFWTTPSQGRMDVTAIVALCSPLLTIPWNVHYSRETSSTPMYCISNPCIVHCTPIQFTYIVDCIEQLYYIVHCPVLPFPPHSTVLTRTIISIYEDSPTINHFGRAISISMKTWHKKLWIAW